MQAEGREGKPGVSVAAVFWWTPPPAGHNTEGFLLQSPSEAIFRTAAMAGMPDLRQSSLMPI